MFEGFHSRESRRLFLYFLVVLLLTLAILFTALTFRYALEGRLTLSSPSLKNWAIYLLLWEGVLAVSVSYAFYRLFAAYERYRTEQEEFLRLLLAALSHKFGNFLSAQKVNLEILKESPSPEALARLQEACLAMEKDLEGVLGFIKRSLEGASAPQGNLLSYLEDLIKRLELQIGPRKVHFKLKEPLFSLSPELEFLLFFLLENAFRHSRERVWIRGGRLQGRKYLLIVNDLSPHPVKGAGLGLYLSQRLAQHLGLELKTRLTKDRFLALLY